MTDNFKVFFAFSDSINAEGTFTDSNNTYFDWEIEGDGAYLAGIEINPFKNGFFLKGAVGKAKVEGTAKRGFVDTWSGNINLDKDVNIASDFKGASTSLISMGYTFLKEKRVNIGVEFGVISKKGSFELPNFGKVEIDNSGSFLSISGSVKF